MNDEDVHDCDDETPEPMVRPWSWMQFLAVGANLAGNLSHSLWAFFDDIKDAAKAHVAVGDQERDAWKALHRDLESL
jgi:hypothetical protein